MRAQICAQVWHARTKTSQTRMPARLRKRAAAAGALARLASLRAQPRMDSDAQDSTAWTAMPRTGVRSSPHGRIAPTAQVQDMQVAPSKAADSPWLGYGTLVAALIAAHVVAFAAWLYLLVTAEQRKQEEKKEE